MAYSPAQEILEGYAEVMVEYGLGSGTGIRPGDVVGIVCSQDAKPLLLEVAKAVWRVGGHVIVDYRPAPDANWNLDRAFVDLASGEQLDYYPDARARGAESAYRFERVKAGRLSWSGCVYGTEGMAAKAGMTVEEYWIRSSTPAISTTRTRSRAGEAPRPRSCRRSGGSTRSRSTASMLRLRTPTSGSRR